MSEIAARMVVVGKRHLTMPKYVYALPGTDSEFIAAVKSAGFDVHLLDFSQKLEVRDGDIFCLQVTAMVPEQVAYLEEIARIGFKQSGLVILPFVTSVANGPSATSILRRLFEPESEDRADAKRRSSFFMEYQSVVWDSLTAEDLRRAILTAHFDNNLRRGRLGLFTLFGSLFAAFNGLSFGVSSAVVVLAVLICHASGLDVTGWRPLLWFLAGPAICMALSVGMNLLMQFKLVVAIWFGADTIVNGGSVGEVLIPTIIGMAAFYLSNRIHESIDIRDLLTCIFDREINHRNPEFRVPEKRPQMGSGEVILWRLNLPVWRLFSTKSLSRIFISHRNSPKGIEVAHWLHDELEKSGDWTVFLDRKHLSGGLWRDQLADGFGGRGVVLCVLTEDDHNKLRWLRREIYAACVKYHSYGTPIPIIIEAGMTLNEVLEAEKQQGRTSTPLHRVHERLGRISWEMEDRGQFLQQLTTTIRKSTSKELVARNPLFLSTGITGIAEQLAEPSFIVTTLAAFGFGRESATMRAVLMLALVVLATDFGGGAIAKLLPGWAGGSGRQHTWVASASRQVRHRGVFVVILIAILGAVAQRNFEQPLVVALLIGLSLNLIDHELWQAQRLADCIASQDRDANEER